MRGLKRTFKSSQTSFQWTWVFNRDLQSQQNVNSLDVRNHHRIWDAQKHLLHTLVKLKKKIVDNKMMNVRIQENVYIVSNIFPSTWVLNRDLQSEQNPNSLDVRNHHRIWDAQKHLLHTLVKLKKKIVDY